MLPSKSLLLLAGGVGLVISVSAFGQSWVTFQNQTGTRISASPSVSTTDGEEKDYSWGDLDQDGDIDLVVARKQPFTTPGGRPNVLFMNESGVLVDRTAQLATASDVPGDQGFLTPTNDRDIQVADLNGDGWLDVVTGPAYGDGQPKHISHPRVYINRGQSGGVWLGLRYEDARIPQLPDIPDTCAVAVGDVTGDNRPDLYFVTYNSNFEDFLLINKQVGGQWGHYQNETSSRLTAQMIESGFGNAAAIVDLDVDGWRDIVKAENGPCDQFRNGGNGFFTTFGNVFSSAVYFMSTGELNNDGRPDLVLSDDGSDRYLLNTGPGANGLANYQNKTFSFTGGGSDDGFGSASRVVDLNNDGFNDVLIADVDVDIPGCSRRLHIYRNLGDLPSVTLQEQQQNGQVCGIPTSALTGTYDTAVFDLNGDGWKDLIQGRCNTMAVYINIPPVGIVFTYPDGLPAFVEPNTPTSFRVTATPTGGTLNPQSGQLHVSVEGAPYQTLSMNYIGGNTFEATLPGAPCPDEIRFYVTVQLTTGQTFTDPPTGAADPYLAVAANGTTVISRDEFEGAVVGWSVVNENLISGAWEVSDPNGTINGGNMAAPDDDASQGAGGKCWVTQNGPPGGGAGSDDVDGGPTRLISPAINLAGTDGFISYARWFYTSGDDVMTVEVSNNGGASWVLVENVAPTASQWSNATFRVSDFVTPSASVHVRFSIADQPNNSIAEGGVDNFQIETYNCAVPCACAYDFDGNSTRDGSDIPSFVACALGSGSNCNCADPNGNGTGDDVAAFVTALLTDSGCP